MSNNAGGVATQKGIDYQNRVAAWFCVRILAEQEVEPLWKWDSNSTIDWLRCETEQSIDDMMVGNSHHGLAFINVKHKIYAGKDPNSPLASVISQFVRQYISSKTQNNGVYPWERPLNPQIDRFVVVTNPESSTIIKTDLQVILGRLQSPSFGGKLEDSAKNKSEKEILTVVREHIEREWVAVTGQNCDEQDVSSLLKLVWFQILDIDDGKVDELRAKEILRGSILADPAMAEVTWNILIQLCSNFASQQSGGDRKTLQDSLIKMNIRLKSSRSYIKDIEKLKQISQETLDSLLPLSQIKINDEEEPIKINRECSQALEEIAKTNSYVIVGEPGAGKSGVLHDVAQKWVTNGQDIIFLAVDRVESKSLRNLKLEFGLEHEIIDILQNWVGDQPALLIIDALDAARSGEKEKAILDLVSKVLLLNSRWRTIISIRQFDFRYNTKLQSLFKGNPHSKFRSNDFSLLNTRHFNIPKLDSQELTQILAQSVDLGKLIQRADEKLLTLLSSPFNIKLMAEMIGSGVLVDSLTPIKTQIELLERYWKERVIQPLDGRDAKELILLRAVTNMVELRSLRVDRAKVVLQTMDAPVLTDVLSANILTEYFSQTSRKVDDKFLAFAHHVLFDYGVARLWLRREISELIKLLEQDPEIVITLRPSLVMHFEYERTYDCSLFWELIFQMVNSPSLPEIGKLIGPAVAVESLTTIEEFSPLINKLNKKEQNIYQVAEKTFKHVAGALMVKATIAKDKFVISTTPDWSELLNLATESLSMPVIYSCRPLLHILCENFKLLNVTQQNCVGKTARNLLNLALSQEERESSLVTSGIEMVCQSYLSNPVESTQLLQQCLNLEHVNLHGHEELFHFAKEVNQLIDVAPDIVESIYVAAFTTNDTSEEKTQLGSSQIIQTSSTRKQDYHLARWKLMQDFPKFLKLAPFHAVKALLTAIDIYSKERFSSRLFVRMFNDNEVVTPLEEQFEIDHKIAFLRNDKSEIWDDGPGSQDDEPVAMLNQFSTYLEEISKEDTHTVLLQQLIDLIIIENRTSAIWRRVIKVATKYPKTLGNKVRTLCWAVPFLVSDSTSKYMEKYLKVIFSLLSLDEREKVERTVLSLLSQPDNNKQSYSQYKCNRLLRSLASEALVTEETRNLLKSLPEIPSTQINHQINSSVWSRPTDEDYLKDQGVLLESKSSQHLQSLTTPVKQFAEQFSNSVPPASEINLIFPSLQKLYNGLKSANQNEIYLEQQSLSWGYLASALKVATKFSNLDREIVAFIKAVLLESANHPDPKPDENEDDNGYIQSWSYPSTRVDVAEGLLYLTLHKAYVDDDILTTINKFKVDPAPAVRLQIAAKLLNLYYTVPDLMWQLIDYFSHNETNKGVLKWLLMSPLNRIAGNYPDKTAAMVEIIFERIREGKGADEVRKECASILAGLYIWQQQTICQNLINRITTDVINHIPEIHRIVFNLRTWLNEETIDHSQEKQQIICQRSFLLMEKILKTTVEQGQRIKGKYLKTPFSGWPLEDQEKFKSLMLVTDSICREIYFASGAYKDPNDEDKISRREKERKTFLNNALPILKQLADYGHPSIAHNLCQTLEYLLPYDPEEVFLLIGKVVKEGKKGGYQFESLAIDLIVKIIEQFIANAEYKSVLQKNQACRKELIAILDIFVDAGWPSARRLTYRMEEIFR